MPANAPRKYVPAPFFAYRTPLLSFDALEQLEPLSRWLEDAAIREALLIASSSLEESLPAWLESPGSEHGRKVERSLVRYLSRMAGRATPFGLFAAHGVGEWGPASQLRIGDRQSVRKYTRLDMDYVWSLVDAVSHLPEVRRALRYVPNSSLHRTQGQYRYIETRERQGRRAYGLVAVSRNAYLDAVLEKAREGATLDALAQALTAADGDIPAEDARAYVESLVEAWLLVPTWAPTLTGPEPLTSLISQGRDIPELTAVVQQLETAQRLLADMDARPPGLTSEAYKRVTRALEKLPASVERKHLFHVDTFHPARGVTVSRRVVDEVQRGMEVLRRLTPRLQEDPLRRFRERFAERYEGRAVPLLEALDEESGIGFSVESRAAAAMGTLLQGFAFPTRERRDGALRDRRWSWLLKRIQRLHRQGRLELALTAGDVDLLEAESPAALADGFAALGSVVAPSAEAVDRGEFRFVLDSVQGASAAHLLGRFCHGDPELAQRLREHLRAEEALRPDAIVAEVVHLPDDRMANITNRPALRDHDIVFLGRSGLPGPSQIEASDLWLSLEEGRLVLRSQRLGREVIPRLASAHNFWMYGLSVYRFLCVLQSQGAQTLSFQWGPLEGAAFLPRVTHGRTVLSLARWSVDREQLETWAKLEGAAQFEAVQRYRQEALLPRWVCLRDGDNQLPIDLDSPLSVDTLVDLVRRRRSAALEELYPGPGELCMEASDGRYVHELVIPFVREPPAEPAAAPRRVKLPPPAVKRTFPPGSEWLYLKLYTGAATADRLLRTALTDTVRKVMASGAADRWFFIRYQDPGLHLRLRFHGEPARLHSEVWPALRDACTALLDDGTSWRLQLDTYEREVERYGGPAGIELAEELFMADSEAALDIIRAYSGDRGADVRWRLALKGMDQMMADLGLSLAERAGVARAARDAYGREFNIERSPRFKDQLSERFRRERKGLEALLQAGPGAGGALQPGLAALARRSERLQPVAQRLRAAGQEGRLTRPLEELVQSYLHMQAIRLLPAEQRAQELLLHDFLTRLYRSSLARGKQ